MVSSRGRHSVRSSSGSSSDSNNRRTRVSEVANDGKPKLKSSSMQFTADFNNGSRKDNKYKGKRLRDISDSSLSEDEKQTHKKSSSLHGCFTIESRKCSHSRSKKHKKRSYSSSSSYERNRSSKDSYKRKKSDDHHKTSRRSNSSSTKHRDSNSKSSYSNSKISRPNKERRRRKRSSSLSLQSSDERHKNSKNSHKSRRRSKGRNRDTGSGSSSRSLSSKDGRRVSREFSNSKRGRGREDKHGKRRTSSSSGSRSSSLMERHDCLEKSRDRSNKKSHSNSGTSQSRSRSSSSCSKSSVSTDHQSLKDADKRKSLSYDDKVANQFDKNINEYHKDGKGKIHRTSQNNDTKMKSSNYARDEHSGKTPNNSDRVSQKLMDMANYNTKNSVTSPDGRWDNYKYFEVEREYAKGKSDDKQRRREKESGGSGHRRGKREMDQTSDFYTERRKKRTEIFRDGVPEVWGLSPDEGEDSDLDEQKPEISAAEKELKKLKKKKKKKKKKSPLR